MLKLKLLTRVLVLLVLPTLAAAQSDEEVAAARLLWIERDYEAALAVIQPAAEAGNAVAQNVLAIAYESGNGLAKDIPLAIHWYEAAAAQGLAKADYNLGILYRDGNVGLPADYDRARSHLERAVSASYASAHSSLGLMYERGQGGPVDMAKAIALYRAGAEIDDVHSLNNLGNLHRTGQGLSVDLTEARDLYQQAADLGFNEAQNNLGIMFEEGMGGAQSYEMALELYRAAMVHGNFRAGWNIATMANKPDVQLLSPVEIYAHCLWAEVRSNKLTRADVRADCDYVAVGLNAEQVAQAEELAATL